MESNKKKISFDFDDTLDLIWVQKNLFAPLLKCYEIIVVTSRLKQEENRSLWASIEALGISKKNVYFTNRESKSKILDKLKCVLHFDDNPIEIHDINQTCNCRGILINYSMDLR